MIQREIYEQFKTREVHSLMYIPYEYIRNGDVIKDSKGLIQVFNETAGLHEIYYSYNTFDEIFKDLEKLEDSHMISFVPNDKVMALKEKGYDVYGHFKEYHLHHVKAYETEISFAHVEDYERLSYISYACQYQTRGFVGQEQNWFHTWMENGAGFLKKDNVTNIIVVKVNDEIKGFVLVACYNETLWIREIAVDPNEQNKGYGHQLMEMAISFGASHHVKKAYLMADKLNLSGHHLYTSYGFEETEDEQIDLVKIIPQKHLDHYLGCKVFVKIDRPMHSVHPNHTDMIYPINYGFLPFTLSMDGCEIDAYIIGPEKPLEYYFGEVVAVIKRTDDEEEKLVVSNKDLTLGEIYENVYFTERYFKSEIVMKSTY